MARRGPVNLRVDDFEAAADYIHKHTRHASAGQCAAVVCPDGLLKLARPGSNQELESISKQPNFIGTYTTGTRIEIIEDDVLFWLRSTNNHLRVH